MRRMRKVLQPQRSFSLNGASGRFSHSKRDLDANALSHDAVLLTLEAANLLAVITLYSSTFPVIRNVVEYRISTVELQIAISCQGHQMKKGSIPRLFNASAVPTTLWNELLLIFEVFDWHLVSFLVSNRSIWMFERQLFFLPSACIRTNFHVSTIKVFFSLTTPRRSWLARWLKCCSIGLFESGAMPTSPTGHGEIRPPVICLLAPEHENPAGVLACLISVF